MGSSGLVVWRLGAGAGTHLTLGQQLGPWQGSLAASPPSAGPSCIPPGLYLYLYLYLYPFGSSSSSTHSYQHH